MSVVKTYKLTLEYRFSWLELGELGVGGIENRQLQEITWTTCRSDRILIVSVGLRPSYKICNTLNLNW